MDEAKFIQVIQDRGMNDNKFYSALKDADRVFAETWKRATGGKLSTWIGPATIERLMTPMAKADKITADQAKAIRILRVHARVTKEGNEDLDIILSHAIGKGERFFKGSGKQLKSPDELRDVYTALGMGYVGRINFVSPKTGLAYSPMLYTAISRLVEKGLIRVYEVDLAGLFLIAGKYRPEFNGLMIYKNHHTPTFQKTMETIVHETTHAIQDWRDLATKLHFAEADAYIAGSVAAMTLDNYIPEFEESKKAGRLVLEGKGVAGNEEWARAYDDVVNAFVADNPGTDKVNTQNVEESLIGPDESAVLDNRLKEIMENKDVRHERHNIR